MEEFLQNMKTFRYQMNDVEDQAAKISVEEQMQITTIQTLQKDLDSAKSETMQVKEDTDLMMKAKGQICSKILEKQRKMADLESDSCTLSQTLALIQQETVNLSAKLIEKRAYYTKVEEDTNTKLQEQQVEDNINEQTAEMEAASGKCNAGSHLIIDNMDDTEKNLMESFDAAKEKFNIVAQMKFNLVSESRKVRQSIELAKSKIEDYKPELKEMDKKSLEEEIQAFLSDKAGETEYLLSLQNQIKILKGISHMVKCVCGVEYMIDLVCA